MNTLNFDASRIEDWAAFSGDRNPIHFDEAAARRLGAEDVIVHGMLPLLYAQGLSAGEASRLPLAGEWRAWHARLKWPLLRDRDALLRFEAAREGLKFSLGSPDGSRRYFHGSFLGLDRGGAAPSPAEGAADSVEVAPIRFGADVLAERAEAFRRLFPHLAEHAWIWISATAFGQFLREGADLCREAALRRVGKDGDGARVDAPVTVVQTTYSVKFDATYFDAAAPGFLSGCECTFSPAEVFDIEGGCATTACWRIRDAETCFMEMAVGLMLKVHRT